MRIRLIIWIVCLALAPLTAAAQPAPVQSSCGNLLDFQVLLDRQGFSPGELDGAFGANTGRALSVYQQAKGLEVSGRPDCATWDALRAADPNETTTTYEITAADLKGPFVDSIPADIEKQASLPALGYRSVLELLSERFHASPALLTRLNRDVRLSSGAVITVPAVEAFHPGAKAPAAQGVDGMRIEVRREDSTLRVFHADGSLAWSAPVTMGSEHDPLPIGDWKVTSVNWMPAFRYNPDLFWDANPKHKGAMIKPGPNNPVGVVWIDISVEHYGLHGTPEPGRVGHTASHGCVRLTNWDAARLAGVARPGMAVVFR